MKKLKDSNREEALKYVVDLYTLFLGEPDLKEAEELRKVHLNQMRKFTHMFDRASEAYLVKEGLRIQANTSEELDKALQLRTKNTDLFKKGIRTKASDVVTLEFPEMFRPKKAEEPKSDDELTPPIEPDEDDETTCPTSGCGSSCGSGGCSPTPAPPTPAPTSHTSTSSGVSSGHGSSVSSGMSSATGSKMPTKSPATSSAIGLLSEEELIENIKKIKDIKDDLLYPTVQSLILCDKLDLGSSLQEKLEYLGFDGYDKFKISDTTNVEILIKDILNTFISIDLTNKLDVANLKFAINKIPEFKEWQEFIEKVK